MGKRITINEELNKMKNLFNHKRGVVISEQKRIIKEGFNYTQYPCINTSWPKGTEDFGGGEGNLEYVQDTSQNIDVKIMGLFYTLNKFKFFENGKFKVGNLTQPFYCRNNKIVIDGVEITPKQTKTTSNVSSNTANTNDYRIDPKTYNMILIKDNGQLLQGMEQYKGKGVGAVYEVDYDYILVSSDNKKTYACAGTTTNSPECYSANQNNATNDNPSGTVNKTSDINAAKKNLGAKDSQQLGSQQSGSQQSGSQQSGSQAMSVPGQIPAELKDAEGVKKFQDWLDTQYPKGWLTARSGRKITVKGLAGNSYGKFGKSASRMWNDLAIRDAYLKTLPGNKQQSLGKDETEDSPFESFGPSSVTGADETDESPFSADVQGSVTTQATNNTTAQATNNATTQVTNNANPNDETEESPFSPDKQ